MSFEFNGETYATLGEWKRAYPVYANYGHYLKAGAKTVTEIESMAHKRRAAGIRNRDAAANPLKLNIGGLSARKRGRKA